MSLICKVELLLGPSTKVILEGHNIMFMFTFRHGFYVPVRATIKYKISTTLYSFRKSLHY